MGDSVIEAMSGVFRSRVSNWSRARAIPQPTSSPAITPIAASLALLSPEGAVGSPAATWMVAYGSPSVMLLLLGLQGADRRGQGLDLGAGHASWTAGIRARRASGVNPARTVVIFSLWLLTRVWIWLT